MPLSLKITAILILLILVNYIASHYSNIFRYDFTEQKIYTLSDGSVRLLEKLQQQNKQITIEFFYSEQLASSLPALLNYGNYIKNLLEQYYNQAPDNINLITSNPEPFSNKEDQALATGIQAVPFNSYGEKLYFGINFSVIDKNGDKKQIAIPFVSKEYEKFLEYEISKILYELISEEKPQISIISSIDIAASGNKAGIMAAFQPQQEEWAIFAQMKDFYNVKVINPDEYADKHMGDEEQDNANNNDQSKQSENTQSSLSSNNKISNALHDSSVLLIIQPENFSNHLWREIEKYLINGKPAMIFIDNYIDHPSFGAQEVNISNSKEILGKWGISISDHQLIADPYYAMRVQTKNSDSRLRMSLNPLMLGIDQRSISQNHIITNNIEIMNMSLVSAVASNDGDNNLTVTPLIMSSHDAAMIEHSALKGVTDPTALNDKIPQKRQQYNVSALFSGKIRPNFLSNHDNHDINHSNIIVTGDIDFMRDKFWVRKQSMFGNQIDTIIADNGNYILGAIDFMSGSNYLSNLRARNQLQREFEVINNLRKNAEQKFKEQEQKLLSELKSLEKQKQIAIGNLQNNNDALDNQSLLENDNIQDKKIYLEQKQTEQFISQILDVRKKLREIQYNLNEEVLRLGQDIKILLIIITPIMLVVIIRLIFLAIRKIQYGRNFGHLS